MIDTPSRRGVLLAGSGGAFGLFSWAAGAATPPEPRRQLTLKRSAGVRPRNILVVFTDARLEESGGMQIPLSPDSGERNDPRDPRGPKGARFPDSFLRPG
ncbi:MAG: hypothetical protein V4610_10075 [Pseudomonadota bacterium]|jgi:hypothetical protein|uniref:Uncharacterized protein n=1 Tax=hydrothermal vent metagenome TaxID=652676 RepID=A0A160TG63_9ZZZZ